MHVRMKVGKYQGEVRGPFGVITARNLIETGQAVPVERVVTYDGDKQLTEWKDADVEAPVGPQSVVAEEKPRRQRKKAK